ncbi:MAG: hypothetical protein HOM58_08320 [Rhodospirillaceae bacterium]|jgi:hypothetical protein|nr:hypothetical protein [Rhodospirillaceae bacterium]MBT5455412.1 hypothetical protein [Rhodospirillaceae bacterium]
MARMSYSVIGVLIATALTGCKTDYQILNEQARAYVAVHKDLDRNTASAIAANRIRNGMSKNQVVAAWGHPVLVQRFDNGLEYWFFGCVWPHQCESLSIGMSPEEQYLSRALFRDGRVIDWRG